MQTRFNKIGLFNGMELISISDGNNVEYRIRKEGDTIGIVIGETKMLYHNINCSHSFMRDVMDIMDKLEVSDFGAIADMCRLKKGK